MSVQILLRFSKELGFIVILLEEVRYVFLLPQL